MNKIGILGGTFDPVHKTHIKMALAAKEYLGLDKVYLMPSKKPPHKFDAGIAKEEDRLNMLKASLENIDGLEASDYELKRDGFTYTADTLSALKKELSDTDIYFLIGEDSLMYIDEWYKPDLIFANARIAAFARGTKSEHKLNEKISSIRNVFPAADIVIVPFEADDVSSSNFRELIKAGDLNKASGIIPKEALDYISKNGLYTGSEDKLSNQEQILRLTEMIRGILKPSRFEHSLGVSYTAAALAMRYGADVYKARVAGILHDCAKYLSDDEQIAFAKEKGIELTEAEIANPALIHAKTGAYFAKVKYEIEDSEIINAIRYHTTGKEDMTLLEKIIFCADYMEPNRKSIPGLDSIRNTIFKDLDKAALMICDNTLNYLDSLGIVPDEQTKKTRDYLKEHMNDNVDV
ncbi:MAG: bis(5'-nucleosyl)-tetraphosphatase (symmetrical) YqeK [Lachnospiraceae bacterium]|nr:bis(5'-nucleosyl)-tetraphosphatase (symmetrical) YqeK [Lachnospiraceae bacterium]